MQSKWMFDTVKSAAAMGTYRNMKKDLTAEHILESSDHDRDSMYGVPPMDSFILVVAREGAT